MGSARLIDRVWAEKDRLVAAGFEEARLAVFATDDAIAQMREESGAPPPLPGIAYNLLGVPLHRLDAEGVVAAFVGMRVAP